MPVYTYECQSKKCGEVFEEYQKLSDEPLKKCIVCKRGKVIKIISLPAKPVVTGHPLDEFKKIRQEAKQIAQRIIKGDEKAIADVYGEDVASSKERKELPKPKQLKEVKGKSAIKRRDK